MTAMMRRLALFGIACATFAMLYCIPNVAWAEQGADDNQAQKTELPTAQAGEGLLVGQPAEQRAGANAEDAAGHDNEQAAANDAVGNGEEAANRGHVADEIAGGVAGDGQNQLAALSTSKNADFDDVSVKAKTSSPTTEGAQGESGSAQSNVTTIAEAPGARLSASTEKTQANNAAGVKAGKASTSACETGAAPVTEEAASSVKEATHTGVKKTTTTKPAAQAASPVATKPSDKVAAASQPQVATETARKTTKMPVASNESPSKVASKQSGSATAKAVKKSVIADGVYIISSAKNPSRVLDVSGASKKAGANVILWDDNGQKNQQWRFIFDEKTGNYTIVSVHSNLALAFKSSSSGANVYQAKLTAATKAKWSIASTSSGFRIYPAGNAGNALDIEGAAADAGDNIELWKSNGKPWQRFWLVAVNPQIAASKTLEEGVYSIALASAKNAKVDVEGASQGNAANVLLYHGNGGFNQRWYLSRDKDDFYTITSINSGKSLDIYGAGRVPDSNVIQYATHGRANQKWQIRDNGNGTYTIVSKQNGLVLKAAGTGDCANVSVFPDNGSASERFVFTAAKLVGDGLYSVSSRQNIGKVVDVPGVSRQANVQVNLWGYNSGANQKYQFVDKGGETYTVQVAHSGKYLQDAGGKVVQGKKNGAAYQLWKATWSGTGVVLTNKATGRAMTVSGTAKDGAPLVTTTVTGKAPQRFMFTKRALVENGLYTLRSGTGSRVLDVDGASKDQGANIQLWSSNDGNNQKFTISAVSDGYYKIVNLNSDKALSAASASAGSNVRQGTYSGSAGQLWKAEVGPNGDVVFTDKQSGQALSVAGNANADGANVRLSAKTGANGQTWGLVATKPHDAVLDRALSQAEAYDSATDYFIAVDLSNHRTVVFTRSDGSWVDVMNVTVSVGAPETPTVTGTFTIAERGYSFGSGYTCYYWTQFYGDYLFHSVLYDEGTFDVQDGRLGYSISHGCVRMDINDAYWINQNVPYGTKVRVY